MIKQQAVIILSDAYRRVQIALFDLDAVRYLGRFANSIKKNENPNVES